MAEAQEAAAQEAKRLNQELSALQDAGHSWGRERERLASLEAELESARKQVLAHPLKLRYAFKAKAHVPPCIQVPK